MIHTGICSGAAAAAGELVGTRISGRTPTSGRTLDAQRGAAKRENVRESEALGRATRAQYLRGKEERRLERERRAAQPAYIRACATNPDRDRTYWLYTWDPSNPAKKHRIPYQCGSWRCPSCQQHSGQVLFARLQQAFRGLVSSDVVFVVLTLDPAHHGFEGGRLDEVYREFSSRQNRWTKRLRRWLDREFGASYATGRRRGQPIPGSGDMGNAWASVTECHRSGTPHVNIALYHPEWAAELRAESARRSAEGATVFEQQRLSGELARHAQECGFGWRCTAEANRYGDTEAISGYLVKGVKRADAMHGELAKLCQIPLEAPKNFRRLRSGVKFLPPKNRGKATGTVIRRYHSPEGDEQTEPLSRSRAKPIEQWSAHAARLVAAGVTLPAELEEGYQDYVRKVNAYNLEVSHCVAVEQALAWRDEDKPGPKGAKADIHTYTRRADGATERSGGIVVLNAPRAGPKPEPEHREEVFLQLPINF